MPDAALPRSRRDLDRETQILLADVARAFYLEGRSKVDIAKSMSLSRFQVAKLIDDALEHGIVTIHVHDPRRGRTSGDLALANALGVEQVSVVEVADLGGQDSAERVGMKVMERLKEYVRPRMTIGISWSRTLDHAARFMPDLPPCHIVQLAGALSFQGAGSLQRVIAQLGENPGIETYPVYAPLVVDEPSTARDLMRQPEIAQALAQADVLDLAVVAIGAWAQGRSTVWDKVSEDDRRAGLDAGAVAEISGRLLDADGRPVHTSLADRIISVTVDQLARTPRVIAVARGAGRVDAVLATVRAGIVSCLVIDSVVADELRARLS